MMYLPIINILVPVAFVISLGWIAGYKNIINNNHSHSFATYIINFSFPCLLFVVTSTTPPSELFNLNDIILFSSVLMGSYLISALIYRFCFASTLAECGQGAFNCTFPDMAFMGIPIFAALFGEKSLLLIVVGNIISSLIMIPLTIILLETKHQQTNKKTHFFKTILLPTIKKPLIVAPFLGAIFSLLHLPLPFIIQNALECIGKTTSGVSLFTLGLMMSCYRIRLNKMVLFNIAVKNIFQPLLMLLLVYLFHVSGLVAKEGILLCAMPTAVMTAIFALKYNVMVEESATTATLGTLFAAITLPIFMLFLL